MCKAAIVILNYNNKSYLEAFLPPLIRYSQGHKIIIVDNGSSDDSIAFVSQTFPEIDLIEFPQNEGFCAGYNKALKQISAEYFVLLNSDVQVTENWLDPVLAFMQKDQQIAACQPKILSYEHPDQFEYAGAGGGLIDTLGYPFCRGRIFNTLENDKGQYNDTRQVFWASGACFIIKASVFHTLGGFDDRFFAHMEEIDLCWRINRAGLKVYYNGASHVYHVGGGTLPKSNPQKTYLNFRNSLWMIYKNMPASELSWKLPARIILDIIAACKFLFSDSTNDFKAVIKSHRDFWRQRKKYREKKKDNPPRQKLKKLRGVYKNSIVIAHFIRGKRHFADLEKAS